MRTGKVDRIESLPPLHRRLLERRVKSLLLFVEKFSFGNVVDDYQLAVLAVKNDRMRTHLHVDRLVVLGLVTPRTRNHEIRGSVLIISVGMSSRGRISLTVIERNSSRVNP